MSGNTHVPVLRFREFSGEWKNDRVDHFMDRTSDPVQVINDKIYREIGVRSHGKGIFHKTPITGAKLGGKRVFWVHPSAFVVNIVFGWEQAVAITNAKECGMIASHRFPMYVSKENRTHVPFFLYFFLRKRGKYLLELASPGGAGRNKTLGQQEFAKLEVIIPSLPEQQKIVAFLTAVDNKIQQLTEKQALLQRYKKGVMQRIFSQKIRFKADDGTDFPDWEEKRLGDIAMFSKGKGISKADLCEAGHSECILYGELYTTYGEVILNITSRTNIPKEDLVLSMTGDVIIPASGETTIDIATAACVTKAGIALGGDLNILRGNCNGIFLSYYLRNAKRIDMARLAQGVSVVHLYSKQLQFLKIKIPSDKTEQQKIANFLSTLDSKINTIADQLTHIQTFKKGLLQKMFV